MSSSSRGRGKVVNKIVHHRTGEAIAIKLHVDTMEFSARIGDKDVFEKDGDKIAALAQNYLESNATVVWQQVIEVSVMPVVSEATFRDSDEDKLFL